MTVKGKARCGGLAGPPVRIALDLAMLLAALRFLFLKYPRGVRGAKRPRGDAG